MKIISDFNHFTNTELLCLALGWQGGTVHQVAKATGLTVKQIIETDRHAEAFQRNLTGWDAVRTCSLEHCRTVSFPKRQGDLQFWMAAANGIQLTLALGEKPYGQA